LHTWASLILGWLLYAIFVTGTLSFFQNEISTWMKPETHQSIPAQSQVQQMQVALNYLQKNHPDAGSWNIQSFKLTIERDPNELVSFCWNGQVKKISSTQFQMTEKNFVPKQDLDIIFVRKF
jgi:uncharacterized iron-regulated membrane protein